MSDPGTEVEVHGAAVSGSVTTGDPEVLVSQIERTREDLARTIDTLAEKVSPAGNMRLLQEKLMEQARKREVQIGAAAVGVAVIGLAFLRVWARHRKGR